MDTKLTSQQVWAALDQQIFGVLGMVTARGEARTVGIVYVVAERQLYVATGRSSWKARHIAANPNVSLTVPFHKRVPLMPWIKVPAATITFAGEAALQTPADLPPPLRRRLYRDALADPAVRAAACVVQITPRGDFLTYGVGVSLLAMRDRARARGRVPIANPSAGAADA